MLCKGLLTAYRQDNVYCLNLYTICCSYMTLDVSGRGGCKVKILKYLFVTYFAALFCFLLFLFVYFFFYIFWCASRIDLGHSGWIIPGTSALLHSLDCLSQHFFQ